MDGGKGGQGGAWPAPRPGPASRPPRPPPHPCACPQIQESAARTFGPVLERASKTDRIRAVASLLRRFNNLFGMPGRVRALAAAGDLEQVVRWGFRVPGFEGFRA